MKNDTLRIVIIGGGFGGINAAKALQGANFNITLIDSRNFHLFQPLLYQVATGSLSPADISFPIRAIFKNQKNIKVVLGKVTDIDLTNNQVYVLQKVYNYDKLIIATGVHHHYFGNEEWSKYARGLKSIEDATAIRAKILSAFEQAELENDPQKRRALLSFVIIGGGPTGVELAGALSELANETLLNDFRNIKSNDARIILIEGSKGILPPYPMSLSKKALKQLEKFGVEVMIKSLVTEVNSENVKVKTADEVIQIDTKTILWAAGVKAESLGKLLSEKYNLNKDNNGRLIVNSYCRINNYENVYVIGDLADFNDDNKKSLPGVAAVAIQQGKYVGSIIEKEQKGEQVSKFKYKDKGNLAVIGRSFAVAFKDDKKISGLFAWLVWIFVHLIYLIGFENRILVSIQWAFNYITRNRSARLITKFDEIN